MVDDLYDFEVLKWAASITRVGELSGRYLRASKESRICGSHVTVDVRLEHGIVTDYAHRIEACALGQAVAAIIADRVIGQTPDQIRVARNDLAAMIHHRAAAPDGHWASLGALEPAADIPTRHQSVLLPFDALLAALEGRADHASPVARPPDG